MEPQQSALYAKYMNVLHWGVEKIDGVYIFFKWFPIIGGIAKIHRPEKLPDPQKTLHLIKQNRVRKLVIEPVEHQDQNALNSWCLTMKKHVALNYDPFLPTKTIRVDLKPPEEQIFKSFAESKRRGVRRALKYDVIIRESHSIDDLIHVKNQSEGILGFITTTGVREMWPLFAPEHMAILLAYSPPPNSHIIAGDLLFFWKHRAYYWIAGALREGKKMFAPTLLVWEGVKLAKKRKCSDFDFVGVWDERLPKQHSEWKGFSKFKEGFGGYTVYYPLIPRN